MLRRGGCDIVSAKRWAISPAVMSVLDRKARMRRRGADESASNILSIDIAIPPSAGCRDGLAAGQRHGKTCLII